MRRKCFYFLMLLALPLGVWGQIKVHDAELLEKKDEQAAIKVSIKNSAEQIKEEQINIKRALIGCRRECDFCKNDQEKFTSAGDVDPGCPEGGYVPIPPENYPCARMKDCMEKYKKDLLICVDFLGSVDSTPSSP